MLSCAASDDHAGAICADALLAVSDPANLRDMVALLGAENSGGRVEMRQQLHVAGPQLIPYLAPLVRGGPDAPETVQAVDILSRIATPDALALLEVAASSPNAVIRFSAVYGLATDPTGPRAPLERLYREDRSVDVRAAAANALGLPLTPSPGSP